MPGLAKMLDRSKVPYSSVFDDTKEESALSVAPILFKLSDVASENHGGLRRWIEEHGSYTSSMILFTSSLLRDEVVRRLRIRLNAIVSENMEVLLRYYDPRVLEAMLNVLSDVQLQDFLSIADCWWYLNRQGALVKIASDFSQDDMFTSPLRLTEQQEFLMLDASEPDQIADQLQKMMPDIFHNLSISLRYDFICRNASRASAIGISGTYEVALYCGVALLHGEDFSSLPQWAEVVGKVQHRAIKFSTALSEE